MSDEPIHFKAGDPVPSWMLDVEPTEKWSKKPSIKFSADLTVVTIGKKYWLLPDEMPVDVFITVSDGDSVSVFAPSKTVVMPMQMTLTMGPDDHA